MRRLAEYMVVLLKTMATTSGAPATITVTSAPSPGAGDKRETILFMGVCHSAGAQEQTFCNFFLLAMLAPALCTIGTLCTPLCISLGVYCGKISAESWRLHLTKSAIHYMDIGMCNSRMWHIPLKDVKDISALEDTYTLVIKMDPKDVYRYVAKPMYKEYDCIILRHCKNAGDFAREVKHQMAAL